MTVLYVSELYLIHSASIWKNWNWNLRIERAFGDYPSESLLFTDEEVGTQKGEVLYSWPKSSLPLRPG